MTSESPSFRAAVAVLALGSVGYGLLLFCWFSLPAYLSAVAAELDLAGWEAGLLTGAIPLTYVPLGVASGLLVDRLGGRRAIALGLALVGTGHALRAGSGSFAAMLSFTLVMGVGGTGLTFGLPKLVSELFAERTGAASSAYMVGSYAGTASAFALGRPLVGPALGGWRPLFRWTGVAVLGFAAAFLVLSRVMAGPFADAGGDDARTPLADVRRVVGDRGLRLLVVVGTMYLLVVHGLQGWLTAALEFRGLAPDVAAQVTTLLVGGEVVGAVVAPALSDRIGRRNVLLAACGALAAAGVGALVVADGLVATAAAVAVAGVGAGGLSPLIRVVPVDLEDVGPSLTGVAVGVVYAVGEAGGFLGPVLVGALRDATGGFAVGLAVLAAGAAVAALAGAAIDA